MYMFTRTPRLPSPLIHYDLFAIVEAVEEGWHELEADFEDVNAVPSQLPVEHPQQQRDAVPK